MDGKIVPERRFTLLLNSVFSLVRQRTPVSEMTYTVSSGTLNSTIHCKAKTVVLLKHTKHTTDLNQLTDITDYERH